MTYGKAPPQTKEPIVFTSSRFISLTYEKEIAYIRMKTPRAQEL
jgi:hypothetical protein